jgi:hypothetical protein
VAKKAIDPTDALVTDSVGPWAAEKHERLKKYIDAYRGARTRGQRLYWLVFVSAHELGRKLWNDIRNVHVQGRLL